MSPACLPHASVVRTARLGGLIVFGEEPPRSDRVSGGFDEGRHPDRVAAFRISGGDSDRATFASRTEASDETPGQR
ncbi:hypothetical protein GCM10009525_53900 [Streptosporangium amethystogenes subsp. fukuiense]